MAPLPAACVCDGCMWLALAACSLATPYVCLLAIECLCWLSDCSWLSVRKWKSGGGRRLRLQRRSCSGMHFRPVSLASLVLVLVGAARSTPVNSSRAHWMQGALVQAKLSWEWRVQLAD